MQLVFIGDSIVEGKSAAPGESFAELLGNVWPGDVRNIAQGGSTVIDTRSQLASLAALVDLVVVGFGVNDSRWRDSKLGHEVGLNDFRSECEALKNELGRMRSTILLSQIPVVDHLLAPYKPDKTYRRVWQQEYEAVKRTALQSPGVSYIDLWMPWCDEPSDWQKRMMPDGLHPASAGHRFIFDQVMLQASGLISEQRES
jgi:lysophospholipase L1-like esterase